MPLSEVTTAIPPGLPSRYFTDGSPLFAAYGCVLLERDTGKSYIYKAVNLENGRTAHISRRAKPLSESAYEDMAVKIRESGVAGAGRYEVDRKPGQNLSRAELAEIQNLIFETLLPEHGYGVREKQMELAAHILESISRRVVSLAEAEVGTGKTHAYLIAAALAKRGRVNDFWLRGHYPDQSYAASAFQPVVISTSSIALQKAIVTDYIPEISRILMAHGIIRTPLTCVIRKGREHYACEKRLRAFLHFEPDGKTRQLLEPLLDKASCIDLGDIDGLTAYIKRKLGVSGRCGDKCPHRDECRYLQHLTNVQSSRHDFQIVNHNYLLADTLRRSKGQRPLIPHYQAVIIDEAHKFLQAARQMYDVELDSQTLRQITDDIRGFTCEQGQSDADVQKLAVQLAGQNKRLFKLLGENIPESDCEDEAERFMAVMDAQASRHLINIRNIIDELAAALAEMPLLDRYTGRRDGVLHELKNIREQADVLRKRDGSVYWLENPGGSAEGATLLCAIPKNLNEMLYADLWNTGVPIVLTSGTLSASGSFGHIKKSTGLDKVRAGGLVETTKPSPFNHRENALLYISDTMPFPNNKDKRYIEAVTDEIERLIMASHGHAAVLFTSYNVMGIVFAELKRRGLPFPLFRLDRGDTTTIERFKQSGNGVLFASGSLWEGIDLPGDILSMLIIVKLPFAVPDPISDYERTLYKSMGDYINAVVVPEMIIKLKQGFGRLLRKESDNGIVAILDSRVCEGGAYRDRVLRALPACRVTASMADVAAFFCEKKDAAYFFEAIRLRYPEYCNDEK